MPRVNAGAENFASTVGAIYPGRTLSQPRRHQAIQPRLVLLAALLAAGCADSDPPRERTAAKLVRVIDGDTIRARVAGVEERVRYIGIDTPERDQRCFIEATRLNERLLRRGRLRLEFDAERRDRFGRLLAYVYAGDTFVNLQLVRRGVADPLTIEPNDRHARLFEAAGTLSDRCG